MVKGLHGCELDGKSVHRHTRRRSYLSYLEAFGARSSCEGCHGSRARRPRILCTAKVWRVRAFFKLRRSRWGGVDLILVLASHGTGCVLTNVVVDMLARLHGSSRGSHRFGIVVILTKRPLIFQGNSNSASCLARLVTVILRPWDPLPDIRWCSGNAAKLAAGVVRLPRYFGVSQI